MTIRTLHAAYARGASAVAAVDACVVRIDALNDPGIFLHLLPPERVRQAAEALPLFDPKRYPLWGVPFAVKDNIDVAGLPTTAACPGFSYCAEATAPVVQLLLEAGAILIGKTNLDQFATGLVGVRTPHPVPRNAFDALRVPGGSSSGSAVAVAQGLVAFALGTDTAGSGRVPAAFNNLVGLKPTLGALSTRGVVPACRTLDAVSIFAGSVEDAAAVFDVAAVYDPAEPYSRPVPAYGRSIARIGIPMAKDLMFFDDRNAADAWAAGAEQLKASALDVVEVDIAPFLDCAGMLYAGPWVAERRAAVGRFMDDQPEALHPVTRRILDGASTYSAVDCFNAIYRLAAFRRISDEVFGGIDALAVPTAPIFPTLAELADDPLGPNTRLGTYTNFVNLLDLAAIAVPGPFRKDGLPAGATFIAPAGSDRQLARLARMFFPGVGGKLATRAMVDA
ncbi:MAG: allophanate hydrolase [Hyphomicrobiales bacterium]|nr:allophanate hydrolase [Hyphomicrobiales bacterium]